MASLSTVHLSSNVGGQRNKALIGQGEPKRYRRLDNGQRIKQPEPEGC